jgi:2-polyprenyl-6-hydroxyphenyl methylase/3-demethylubiquinone-9 3-methyltransferase
MLAQVANLTMQRERIVNISPNYAYWQAHGSYWVDEYRRRQRRQPCYGLQELALTAILEANAPARVLEFGCGVGRHLSHIAKIAGIEVHGVDQSPTMLAGMRQWVAEPELIASTHLVEPTGRLPFADGSFDLVYTTEVLLHIAPADIISRLAELVRVTRRAVIHFEPPADYRLFAQAHDGCWWHDLIELYAGLGISARRIGRPIEAQEVVIAEIDPAYQLVIPGAAFFRHMHDVECRLEQGLAEVVPAASSSPMPPDHMIILTDRLRATAPASLADVEAAFTRLPDAYRARVEQRQQELQAFCDSRILSPEIIASDHVVDWEAGDCAFAVAMLRMGAQRVFAIDSWMNESEMAPSLLTFPGLLAARCNIHDLAASLRPREIAVDLVFCNTVTEHVQDLVSSLAAIRGILRRYGYFFTNHDNYYQPVGSHDHGFLFYGNENAIDPQGVACWRMPKKCGASEEHRQSIKNRFPWTWNESLEKSRNPDFCAGCFYYKRSQPWAHLIYQTEFCDLFPSESFFTGTKNSSLNKITTFQLRQFIVESGLEIRAVNRTNASNDPPELLLNGPFFFHPSELTTCTIRILAQAM